MNKIIELIQDGLNQLEKGRKRIDFFLDDKKIRIYKCGTNVTRIDIVKEEK